MSLIHIETTDLRNTEARYREEAARRRSADNQYRLGSERNAGDQDTIALKLEMSADQIAAEIAHRAYRAQRRADLESEAARRTQVVSGSVRLGQSTCPAHGVCGDDISQCELRFAHEGPHRGHGDRGVFWLDPPAEVEPAPGWEQRAVDRARTEGVLP